MRKHHTITAIVVVLLALATKVFFFSAPTDANAVTRTGLDVSTMHQSVGHLPVQKIHDMTFVYAEAD